MVPPDGETLNALFEVFADWDDQLRHSDFERVLSLDNQDASETETADVPSPGGLS